MTNYAEEWTLLNINYVLVLLFVKYVSDKAASQKNYLLDVPEGGRFSDMVALKGDKEIGDKMNKIKGHHRTPGESLLRHRNPGLHCRARQGTRPARKGIFMIDASKGFIKDGKGCALTTTGLPAASSSADIRLTGEFTIPARGKYLSHH